MNRSKVCKFETEALARQDARHYTDIVYIIESRGYFYVEYEPSLIRSWERLVYEGPGTKA